MAAAAPQTIDLSVEAADVLVFGEENNGNVGFAVASCDVNGDGFEDMIIGAPSATPDGRSAAGKVYVITGNSSLPAEIDLGVVTADLVLYGELAGDRVGRQLTCGDVSGDGIDDIIVGAPFANPSGRNDAGTVYVIYGVDFASASLPATIDLSTETTDVQIYGGLAGDKLGSAVAVGDVDGSGVLDLIIGASRADAASASDAGRVFLFLGGSLASTIDLDTTLPDFQIWGAAFADNLGSAVAAGDVNGDGFADIIAAATAADPNDSTSAGEVYVVYGTATPETISGGILELASESPDVRIMGDRPADLAGRSLAAGDLNHDGYDDVIIGAYAADPDSRTIAGKVYVLYGNGLPAVVELGDDTDVDVQVWGAAAVDGLGWAVHIVNFNGDGIDDLLIGGPLAIGPGGANTGRTVLLEGDTQLPSTIDLASTAPRLTVLGADSGDLFGYSVAAGDLNADGIDDLLIGAFGADPVGSNAGEVYVIYGTPPYVELSAPDTSATYLQDLLVPVTVDSTNGLKMRYTEVDLLFDSGLLTYNGIVQNATLTDGWALAAAVVAGTGADLDTLRLTASTTGAAATVAGTLFVADFTVLDIHHPASSPLAIDHLLFNGGRPEWNQTTDGSVLLVGDDGRLDVTVVSEPGDTVRVRVVDSDLNLNATAIEMVTVDVVSPRTGETEAVVLTEVSVDDSVFFGSVKTVAGAGAGTDDDGEFQVADDDILLATYVDSLDAGGNLVALLDTHYVLQPLGDVDDNGVTQVFDAARILAHAAGLVVLTGRDSLAANIDAAAPYGPINAFDASLAIQLRLGKLAILPVREPDSDNHPQPETAAAAPRVAGERLLSLRVADGALIIGAEDRSDIVSGDLIIEGLRGRVLVRPSPDLLEVYVAQATEGDELRIAFAAAAAARGEGELLRLLPLPGSTLPRPDELVLRGWLNGDLPVTSISSRARGIGLPARFDLLPNHPNPFNAETRLRFDLPTPGSVRLEIYNGVGQRVRTLIAGTLSAGRHEAVWDGRLDDGTAAASGAYTAVLRAPATRLARPLLLLK